MMVPKSYKYASSPTKLETQVERGLGSKQTERKTSGKTSHKENAGPRGQLTFLPTQSVPAKPVVIPTRTRENAKRGPKKDIEKLRRKSSTAEKHDPAKTPPATAACLTMTSAPDIGKRMALGSKPVPITQKRRYEQPRQAISSSSPQTWDFLLSPPRGEELGNGSYESDATLGPMSSVRSMSTESMPSLAEDDSSISSDNPMTPALGSARGRNKSLSSSVGKDCAQDHPLLQTKPVIPEAEKEEENLRPSAPARTKTSFKSNLTASFRAIRSAARSLSELAPPLREDHLSRSILSIDKPFTDEKRPRPSQDLPDPALRRYLNPIKLSAAELHFHTEQDPLSCHGAVQMQSYQPGSRQSVNASSPPIFANSKKDKPFPRLSKAALDTEDALISALPPKQREPRENADFLRVIVLEMNMRKVGKLNETTPGRARLWLPARQGNKSIGGEKEESEPQRSQCIPRRWVSEQP